MMDATILLVAEIKKDVVVGKKRGTDSIVDEVNKNTILI